MSFSRQDVVLILEGLVSFASQHLQQIDLQENFNVIRELGHGGYGSVLMVKDKKTDEKKALKLLDRKKTTELKFLVEFSMSFFLSSHPNIIGIYGTAFKTCDYFAFTQELSLHGDLLSLLPPHDGLPEDTVKRCAVQVSSALEFIDSKGLVHLDIKPENILVFDKGCHCIKMTDFGLSRVKGTIINTRSGTSSYMAPEMRRLTDKGTLLVDSTLDIWSFGILLYCLLTSEFPWQSAVFTDERYSRFVQWQNNRESIEPPSPWSRLPPGVLKMFSGLLAIDCNKRSKSTDILMFLNECWKRQIEETLDDVDATGVNSSEEYRLSNHEQESNTCKKACARTLTNISHNSISISSLLSDMSCNLICDSSESEKPSGDRKDDVLNLLMFMDDEISVHVGAEVETRIRRNLSDARSPLTVNVSGVSRHFREIHSGDVTGFSFSGIERVFPSSRGGDLRKKLLHREAKWIFDLNTRNPNGLNLRSDILFQLH